MPSIVKVYGYHVYFWSDECEPLEPIHFHISVKPHKAATKVWILSDGTLLIDNNNDNIPVNDLKRVLGFMSTDIMVKMAEEKWINHFGEMRFFR